MQLAESGRKQLEQLLHQLQEQLQINLLQQTHMMQASEKAAQNKISSSASASALQQLQIQQQQLVSQLQLVQQRILMVRICKDMSVAYKQAYFYWLRILY